MSVKHPIIAITGSSGAGTSTVMQSFQHIFRREKINAQIIEGDSFHRYDRLADARQDDRRRKKRAISISATSARKPTCWPNWSSCS